MVRYMPPHLDLSSDTIVTDKPGFTHDHFKWTSIKKFVYLGCTFASTSTNFDIFSNVISNVRIFDFIVCQVLFGMPYMFMDFFIKQYTKNLDFNKNLNPLLKGISIGVLLQTALWAMLHASDLADSIRYLLVLLTSLKTDPGWAKCGKVYLINDTCWSAKDVIRRCRAGNITHLNETSTHIKYVKAFTNFDKNVLTVRFFSSALVWIFNFFCSTVTTNTLIKIFKLSILWKLFSTVLILCVTIFFKRQHAGRAFAQILNVTAPSSYATVMDHIPYVYGIGFIGVYDYGTMSSYTMVDNAVVIFTIVFTLNAFARSLITRILYLVLRNCVEVEISITPHYLLFAILPMSLEFFNGHKLYIIYIYVNLMLGTNAYLAMLTLSMSKLLHSEFGSMKNMYIVGILCFLGFSLSVPISIQSVLSSSRHQGLIYGLKVTVLYLGGFKVAIVMWIYGIERFSTDIHFWLGFKPTKFWTMCWMFLPIVLLSFFINRVYTLIYMTDFAMALTAAIWIGFTILAVAVFHLRTLGKYLISNNIANIFKSSSKYGPPDRDDRKKRVSFDETIQLRQCSHNCNVLDDIYECNHLPLTQRSKTNLSSSSSTFTESVETLATEVASHAHH